MYYVTTTLLQIVEGVCSVPAKKFWKSVYIWRKCVNDKVWNFLDTVYIWLAVSDL